MKRRSTSLLATIVVGAALCAPATAAAVDSPSSAPEVPWGAGCEPAPSAALRAASNCGATLIEGNAVPPTDAPPVVKRVIAAANEIDETPYIWGGGHGSFESSGYDCSGAVSYALHGGGLLESPLDSTGLETWGEPGPGKWITVYANAEHAWMIIGGLAFDTVGGPGPRWHDPWVDSPEGFIVRHPAGY